MLLLVVFLIMRLRPRSSTRAGTLFPYTPLVRANGTAMFEGVTVIFLAQFFGIDLTLQQQVVVMLVCILGGIGTAGVPAGSLPVIALILASVGVPPEGKIGRAHVCTPVTTAHLVCRPMLEKQTTTQNTTAPH